MRTRKDGSSMKRVGASNAKEPIAIIGIGCRYPGAANVEQLWDNLLAGKDSVGPYPMGRFPGLDRVYASAGKSGYLLTNEGGFLPDFDAFDAQFFELSPREALYMDPQHRLLLEVSWDALEDAGQVRADYQGSLTSVFIGQWTSEYEARLYESGSEPDFYSIPGCARASASGRISFAFGFEGPSINVDSACSSSLVAVQLACESLWLEESGMALAGGVNLILGREISELFTRAGMLSPDGRCKFGDVRANGFVRSEGAGIVVLKRLSRARADGDRIYALIRGGAINSDGRTSGLLVTPSRPGQRRMLDTAWRAAGIDPADLRYIEAHGTGTSVGDPVELGAIADALAPAGLRERCAVGSIKSNIGHTEAAAGIAGLIKTALVLRNRVIPPSLHCETPNPKLSWQEMPIRIASSEIDLRDEPRPLLAAVSAFGITGTNAHIVLEEADPLGVVKQQSEQSDRTLVLPISAHSPQALEQLLDGYRRQVASRDDCFQDLCYTAAMRRNHHEFRTALVCANRAELAEALEGAVRGESADTIVTGRAAPVAPRVVFVAPGQGSQWPGMATELYRLEPAFRAAFDACDQAIMEETGWSLRERLLSESAEEYLQQIDVIQPALFAMSLGLAAVWRHWGIEPDAVVGHSMGEVAAACLAGVLSLRDAAAVICRRSRLMRTLRSNGGMAVVELPLEDTEAFLAKYPGLSVAASNGPSTTVISGDLQALEEALHELEARDVYCRQVKVDIASHSSQVDPILEPLLQELGDIEPRPAKIPMLSTVTASYAATAEADGTRMDAHYWVRNLRQCVLLATAVRQLVQDGHSLFLELSPHPILLPSIESSGRLANPDVMAIASLRREKPAQAAMLAGLATVYTTGHPVRWERLFPLGGRCVRLPQYPFQRDRCCPEPARAQRWQAEGTAGNPILGIRFTSSRQPQTVLWESRIGIDSIPYLKDHRVLGSAVFPAAAYVEMALSGIRALYPENRFALVDATFRHAAYLPETGGRIFQLAITAEEVDAFSFEVRSRIEDETEQWVLHATGQLHRLNNETAEDLPTVPLADLQANCTEIRDAETHYDRLAKSGLQYGPAFRLVEEARVGTGRSVCRLRYAPKNEGAYVFHPVLLDACLQSIAHVWPERDGFESGDTYLPVSIGRVQVHADLLTEDRLYAAAELAKCDAATGSFSVNLRLLNERGIVLAEVAEMKVQRVAHQDALGPLSSLYTLRWVAEPPVREPAVLPNLRPENWIIFADSCGVAENIREMLAFGGGSCTLVRPGESFLQVAEKEYTVRPDSRRDLDELLTEVAQKNGPPTAMVHLWAVRDGAPEDADGTRVMGTQVFGSMHVPLVVQAVTAANWPTSPRLWMVTSGSIGVDLGGPLPRFESAPMWGIGRSVAQEHPELRATLVDLSIVPEAVEARELARRIHENGDEDRIALRGQQAYVARLAAHGSEEVQTRAIVKDEQYRVHMDGPASLDGLRLLTFQPRNPGPGEVAIEISAAGLNFIDLARVMGIYPGVDPTKPLRVGMECAGRITAVGEGVFEFQPGDEVLAITPSLHEGLMASYAVLPAEAVLHKPTELSFEQAATTPIAFLTAYYSLVELAHIREGEWVLIHAAAGGVGLAAIEVAKAAGARIIATVGSKEKEEFVRSLGVSHIFSSRSPAFAAAAMEVTGGRGVDVVLNSLSGGLIDRGVETLAPYGRFVELGKRDVYDDRQLGLRAFRKNISFHVVDLADMIETQRPRVRKLLEIILDRIAQGQWRPVPVNVFAAQDPGDAFRLMAQARHIGKIAIQMGRDVSALPGTDRPLFSANAGYLITGGLGGIALTVAEWMARQGAGLLLLMSRRAVSEGAAETIRLIEATGCRVRVMRGDVTRRADVDEALRILRSEGFPLRGVLHAAAVVDDVLIREMTLDRFARVMAPKVEGTWNLHAATLAEKLDFFVLFSSIATIHPQPGMGIYAAANAFLDGFAEYRRALGMPATSVNWGGWNQIGLARVAGTERSLEGYREQGIRNLAASEALEALGVAIRSHPVQMVVVPFAWKKFAEFHGSRSAPLFKDYVAQAAQASGLTSSRSEIVGQLADAASAEQRAGMLEAWLQATLGRVLKLAVHKIDLDRPFGAMGLDSLMGIEFVRRLSVALEIPIPATVVFNYPSIRLLTRQLLQRLNLQQRETTLATVATAVSIGELPEVSEEEALQELMSPEGRRS
jgi:acyl transferase domain-containing protein/NADPH:quinone reductase-like Zn-dependent oxidoreductase/NADP-dependent 3-hydroxy acid dehydrogenase YdfG